MTRFTIAIILLATSAAAQELPVITTHFVITSDEFKQTLTPAHKQHLEQIIALHASDQFPFIVWSAGTPPQGRTAAAQLTVTLFDDKKQDGNDNYLRYDVTLGTLSARLDFAPPQVLYAWWKTTKPWRNPQQLQDDICTRLACDFTTTTLPATLHATLLQRIPLPTTRPWPTATKRVVVPIPWRQVAPDRDSRLEVTFKSQPQGLAERGGHADITYMAERTDTPDAGVIEGMLENYICPPTVTKEFHWPDEIKTVFAEKALNEWAVYMRKYQKQPFVDTNKGRVMQPGGTHARDRAGATAPAEPSTCQCSTGS
jgi:hypothetical protein